MASLFHLFKLLALCFAVVSVASFSLSKANIDETGMQLVSEALDWPMLTASLYGGEFGDEDGDAGEDSEGIAGRRSLFWKRMRYYISYGALSANRIPCPPRSGRSYYTHNCYKARGQAHPYSRGCSKITRCRR